MSTTDTSYKKDSAFLTQLAMHVMEDLGLAPDFFPEAIKQASEITKTAPWSPNATDLRKLLWCSIDNDDSKDLDQLTYAEKNSDGTTTLWVAIADVDSLVAKNTPIDQHAQINTTSVYTPAKIFPMLPINLSTNLTSLNENEDRPAMITKMVIDASGAVTKPTIFQGIVHNYAKLTYNAVGAWLDGTGVIPDKIKAVPGMEKALRCQHEVAQLLKGRRHEEGSLTLDPETVEAKVSPTDKILLQVSPNNFANQLIEEFMIAANFSLASLLIQEKIPSLRRVVRVPKRWDRIVAIAKELGEKLPYEPNSKALDEFLIRRKAASPETFQDLSLAVIKLLGNGEYIVENVGDVPVGHFGLALSNYTHATAPNRRFPDLISQRQYKAFLNKQKAPYTMDELQFLAEHCTKQEDAATKVERRMTKSAAALLLSDKIGTIFTGIVTGVNDKGTWVRIFNPPVEGKVVRGCEHIDVGDRVSVKLMNVDVANGFIDFECHKH